MGFASSASALSFSYTYTGEVTAINEGGLSTPPGVEVGDTMSVVAVFEDFRPSSSWSTDWSEPFDGLVRMVFKAGDITRIFESFTSTSAETRVQAFEIFFWEELMLDIVVGDDEAFGRFRSTYTDDSTPFDINEGISSALKGEFNTLPYRGNIRSTLVFWGEGYSQVSIESVLSFTEGEMSSATAYESVPDSANTIVLAALGMFALIGIRQRCRRQS